MLYFSPSVPQGFNLAFRSMTLYVSFTLCLSISSRRWYEFGEAKFDEKYKEVDKKGIKIESWLNSR